MLINVKIGTGDIVKSALPMRSLALWQPACQWGSQLIHKQTNTYVV